VNPSLSRFLAQINQKELFMPKLLPCFAALVVTLGMCISTHAAPLIASIDPLPIPSLNPGIPAGSVVNPVITTVSGGFTGTWSSPAAPDWIGTFTATGPIPAGTANPAGTTVYDFTALPTGALPVGSIIRIGDLDKGAGVIEQFTLSGTCTSCSSALGFFLDEPYAVVDTIDGNPTPAEMPGVVVSGSAPSVTYLFDGSGITGSNPSILIGIKTNQPLTTLTVIRSAAFANFSIAAPPIPEPASAALLGIGSLLVLARRRATNFKAPMRPSPVAAPCATVRMTGPTD
jgi:PEP-CTERM motif